MEIQDEINTTSKFSKRSIILTSLGLFLLILLFFVGFFLGIKYDEKKNAKPVSSQNVKAQSNNFNSPNLLSSVSHCPNYSIGLDKSYFLESYTAKNGDNLLSILQKNGLDTNRLSEFKYINNINESTGNGNTFIEVGWKIFLPPKYTSSTSGYFFGIQGEIIKKDGNIWYIQDGIHPFLTDADIRIIPQTVFLGKQSFNLGDCVTAVRDNRINDHHAIAVTPQGKNYFQEWFNSHNQ